MSEQWGSWSADPPRVEESTGTPSDVVEQHRTDEPLAEVEPAGIEPDVDEPAAQVGAEPTGDEAEEASDPAVSAVYALRQRLAELEELPIEQHPATYERLHAELTAALGQIDGGA